MSNELKKREFKECHFTTSDGVELYYKNWTGSTKDKAIVLFHRGHEHSGRMQHVVDELEMPEVPMFCWDARGHGMSPGERGYSPSIGRTVQDIEEFINHICTTYDIKKENIFVIAQSVGAVTAITWAHDYAPKIRGMVVASPAFDVKLYVPFAKQLVGLAQKITGKFFVNSYVNAKFLTHDEELIDNYNKDPLISRPIAANILLGLYKTADRVIEDAHAIKLPMQVLISGSDCVVHLEPEHKFFDNLGSEIKEKHVFDGFYHDTLGEKDRAVVIEKVKNFINKLYSMPLQLHDYTNEDLWSKTADILRELQSEPACCFKRAYFKMATAIMKTIGKLSDGIKLGWETGFDSGSTLDYVYRNEPSGKCLIGKLIDKEYLNSAGWSGIRQRKVNIEKIIKEGISRLQAENKPVRITDIAAGHGRYILDAIGDANGIDSVLFRDYSELNVEKGSALIKDRGLEDKVKFVVGNAFDRADLAKISPAPTLAIVSGLYELFPYNDNIRASLGGLSDAMESGSYLVYTDQPWHPQLEFIARALTSHRQGQAWAMRCRTQGEMDALVEEAGFEKIMQLCDEDDIFSVSLARKKR